MKEKRERLHFVVLFSKINYTGVKGRGIRHAHPYLR